MRALQDSTRPVDLSKVQFFYLPNEIAERKDLTAGDKLLVAVETLRPCEYYCLMAFARLKSACYNEIKQKSPWSAAKPTHGPKKAIKHPPTGSIIG